MTINRLSVLLVSLGCGLPCVATAADYLAMDLEQLMQVSVTGSTLRDEALKTVPSAVTVFTHEQIAVLGVDYLYELLSLVPDYQVDRNADHAVNYTFSARGRRNGAQAREILLLVDGRLFSNPRSGSSDAVIPAFPLAQIERVEIIRGPGSALYGSSAFTGVINVITRKREAEVSIDVGSEQRRGIDVLWGQETGDWETSLYAHAYEDKGQTFALRDMFTPVAQHSTDAAQTVNMDVGIRYNLTQLRIAYNRTESGDFYSLERIRNGFNNNKQGFAHLSLEQGFALADNIKSTLALSYSRGEQHVNTEIADDGALLTQSLPPSSAAFLTQAVLNGETYRAALANDWSINDYSSSQFGIELREDTEVYAQARSNYDLAQFVARDFPVNYYGDELHHNAVGTYGSLQSLGIYGQYLQQVTAGMNLTLGVRYDSYNDIADHLSPRLGIVQQLTDNQTLKLLYGEAFRAPTLSETGLINNTRLVGNPDLTHELVKTWDLVWMGSWQRSSISINGFYSHYDQPIIAGLMGATRTYINGGSERSNGISLEASQQLNQHWLARITYSHFLELPDSAFREADQISSLMLNYKRQHWNWNMTAVYLGERQTLAPANVRNALGSFWVVNSKLGYQLNSAVGVNLQLKNMLDEAYFTPAQGNGIVEGVPNRGREWSLGVDWRW
jgi:outer membrane receptor protein involved in Fe transport